MGTIATNIVLRANSLVAGSLYTFSLSAAYLAPTDASSGSERRLQQSSSATVASTTFLVNSPPSLGFFAISPTEGEHACGSIYILGAEKVI